MLNRFTNLRQTRVGEGRTTLLCLRAMLEELGQAKLYHIQITDIIWLLGVRLILTSFHVIRGLTHFLLFHFYEWAVPLTVYFPTSSVYKSFTSCLFIVYKKARKGIQLKWFFLQFFFYFPIWKRLYFFHSVYIQQWWGFLRQLFGWQTYGLPMFWGDKYYNFLLHVLITQ